MTVWEGKERDESFWLHISIYLMAYLFHQCMSFLHSWLSYLSSIFSLLYSNCEVVGGSGSGGSVVVNGSGGGSGSGGEGGGTLTPRPQPTPPPATRWIM